MFHISRLAAAALHRLHTHSQQARRHRAASAALARVQRQVLLPAALRQWQQHVAYRHSKRAALQCWGASSSKAVLQAWWDVACAERRVEQLQVSSKGFIPALSPDAAGPLVWSP